MYTSAHAKTVLGPNVVVHSFASRAQRVLGDKKETSHAGQASLCRWYCTPQSSHTLAARSRLVTLCAAADDGSAKPGYGGQTGHWVRGRWKAFEGVAEATGESAPAMETPTWGDGGGISGAWETHKAKSREGFKYELTRAKMEEEDVLMWTLHVAAEDDALSTHSVVELPVKLYAKRVASLANELVNQDGFKDCMDEAAVLNFAQTFLFHTKKFSLARKQVVCEHEMYSPYRVYMHHVLAQRCGSPGALAAVLTGLLAELTARGLLTKPFLVKLPSVGGVAGLPCAWLEEDADPNEDGAYTDATGYHIILESLNNLKQGFWPWEWVQGSSNGFLPAAEAAIGNEGRFGRNVMGVFVPPKGRAFGDVKRALNATERLVLLDSSPAQLRDYGVLLYHTGRLKEAYENLQAFVKAAPELTTDVEILVGSSASPREDQVLKRLIQKIEMELAEAAFMAPSAQKPSGLEP